MARPLTDQEILEQIPRAKRRARRAQATEPHAANARYDRRSRSLVVNLTNGTSFSLPVSIVAGLEAASEAQLAAVEVGPAGVSLHWEALDVDLSVASLARLVFGGRTLARAAGARAGSARSPAKAEAARRNGAKGGRPRSAPPAPRR